MMQKISMTRRIEKAALEFDNCYATHEDMQKFIGLWRKLNPKIYEVIIE